MIAQYDQQIVCNVDNEGRRGKLKVECPATRRHATQCGGQLENNQSGHLRCSWMSSGGMKHDYTVRYVGHAEVRDIDRLISSPGKLFQGISICNEIGQAMSRVSTVSDIVVHSMSKQLDLVLQLYRAGDDTVYVTTDLIKPRTISGRKGKEKHACKYLKTCQECLGVRIVKYSKNYIDWQGKKIYASCSWSMDKEDVNLNASARRPAGVQVEPDRPEHP